MKTLKMIIVGVLIDTAIISNVLAAGDSCLQNNRIWGWQAVDDRTLVVTDRSYDRYTVKLSGGCIGLDKYAGVSLKLNSRAGTLCVSSGDRVSFPSPGLGTLTCSVSEVKAGVPQEAPK